MYVCLLRRSFDSSGCRCKEDMNSFLYRSVQLNNPDLDNPRVLR